MGFFVGTDIGGTFTDCVVLDEKGNMLFTKASSTPPDFEEGLVDSLRLAAEKLSLSLSDLLSRTKLFSHGCTVATNTLINRNGAKVGFLTTTGFEETLWMMRGSAYCQGLPVEAWYQKTLNERPFDLVPLSHVVGISERVDKDGEALVQLNEEEIRQGARHLVENLKVEAISICFLWSFVNPSHERRAKEILLKLYPDIYVDISSDIVPLLGEYERASTTALNSYLRPAVDRYVSRLQTKLAKEKLSAQFYLMQANGGLLPAKQAAESAVKILHSGPTGGVMAAKLLGERLGIKNIITTDMGGTSFDVSLMYGGQVAYTTRSTHERHVVAAPMVDVLSIGAGGGSIAYVEEGALKVGPKSAGAVPGPVCYGRGGRKPTVTDANLVLGFLNPDYFLGGRMKLDVDAAKNAIQEHIAKPLGMSIIEAAAGIYRIVNAHMSDATRFYCLQRGYDPRDFVLFLFGGATPAHGAPIGADLEVKTMVVPLSGFATVLSAFGIINSDLTRFYTASKSMPLMEENMTALSDVYQSLEGRAKRDFEEDGFSDGKLFFNRMASMRYHLQLTDVDVEIPSNAFNGNSAGKIAEVFDRKYAELYGKGAGFAEAGRDINSQFVRAVAKTPKGKLAVEKPSRLIPAKAVKGFRKVYFPIEGRFLKTRIFDGDLLRCGNKIKGPAVLEMSGTTVVIPPEFQAELDGYRNIVLSVEL